MAFDIDDPRLPALFREKIQFDDETGCWTWAAYRDRDGYGQWKLGRKLVGTGIAHRVAYLLLAGEIAEGLQVDHLCRTRECVNPEHLEPVSTQVNTARGENYIAQNARKTHCPQGHPYGGDNLVFKRTANGGSRVCRTCRNKQALSRFHAVVRDPNTGPTNAEKTHCKNGHPLDAENTHVQTDKAGRRSRACRACGRDSKRRQAEARREVVA